MLDIKIERTASPKVKPDYTKLGFGKYFTDFACPGTTGLLKGDNIKLMVERHNLKAPVYVGDTYGDQTAAAEAGVPFAFAAYGFGEATKYDYKLSSFEELAEIF